MDLFVTFAVLCAAFAHAIWNAFVKTGDDHLISITGIAAGATLTSLVIFPFSTAPDVQSWPYIFASILIHVAYMIALSQAYRYSDFSSAYPIARGSAPMLVFAWSFIFLQEVLSAREILAVFGILLGIMVFSTRRLGAVVNDRKAIWYALLTAVCIAAYTIVDGIGVRLSNSVSGYMVWMTTFEIFPLLLYTWFRRGPKVFTAIAKNARPMLFAGMMAVGGYWIIIWAMTQAPIALVAALRETSIIIAALIGAYYFKEPSGKRRIIAAIIVCVSVVILRL
ncbi:MAG: EamA family transporter [Proteobacteria bacterium]|nr:EamA family transporter [Pseudomonadota bacterium]